MNLKNLSSEDRITLKIIGELSAREKNYIYDLASNLLKDESWCKKHGISPAPRGEPVDMEEPNAHASRALVDSYMEFYLSSYR